ncbi:hypothetical protein EVA_18114 [gut metagenome]|uniref:Uncharacterized protein n=1 Tax=gut metagenome TaxID=749906 RepID=J9G2I4_9ZZZZ
MAERETNACARIIVVKEDKMLGIRSYLRLSRTAA